MANIHAGKTHIFNKRILKNSGCDGDDDGGNDENGDADDRDADNCTI